MKHEFEVYTATQRQHNDNTLMHSGLMNNSLNREISKRTVNKTNKTNVAY